MVWTWWWLVGGGPGGMEGREALLIDCEEPHNPSGKRGWWSEGWIRSRRFLDFAPRKPSQVDLPSQRIEPEQISIKIRRRIKRAVLLLRDCG